MRILTIAAAVVGWATIAAAAVSLTARYLPVGSHILVVATAFSPYLMFSAIVGVVVFALRRNWFPMAIAIALVTGAVTVEGPLFVSETVERAGTSPIRVITANLYLGQTDPTALVTMAESSADLLAVQELTPEEAQRLSAAGIDRTFPYRILAPKPVASGTGLWSRFPISQPTVHHEYVNGLISGRLHIEGIANDLTVLVTHMPGPWPQPIDMWEGELRTVPKTLDAAAKSAGSGCVIVAGDFNATYDMKPFRDLLTNGYRDGADQSGSGITATYPANNAVPPFMAIDHVLTRQCTVASVDVVTLPGSDHRGLRSTIDVPKSP